mmetsp:Transcript_32683/g.48401  ORF Transcript_32683/g.48401 Transcript_32683/m.48401 type:complete len:369 (-) Transcript_32683:130-1236(-)|eukprot:CAMPEP_0194209188 /NCGR_PEP_ID=MMETSP0156-20130528/7399_1 /TAXON_ID=33649 /ORGANISM="Thalassionema nitzschioides, Strain L26-B" /LENGTH=368 /DNA_ID=CAMNT_0038936313 /DNA_START=117 /DNA_END=1223 /DNA_ORIENTATION=-
MSSEVGDVPKVQVAGTEAETSSRLMSSGGEKPPAIESAKRMFSKFSSNANKFGSNANESLKNSFRNIQKGVGKHVDASASVIKNLKESRNKVEHVHCETEDEALKILKEWIDKAKVETSYDKRPQKWNFVTTPLSCFDKTLDDVFLSFCRWAKESDSTQINVTRAFERLTSYATWMDKTNRDMIDPPLTTSSIEKEWETWGMKVSHDKAGRLVWWLDLSRVDLDEVQKIPSDKSLRLFVWFSHLLMFDSRAQEHGCVFIQNMGKIPFWNGMTHLVPPRLAQKVQSLTVGVMPIRMKHIYACESPKWTQVLLGIMKPFLSQTVKDRIVCIENPKILEDILGQDCIPSNFVGTDGTMEKDDVFSAHSIGH